MEWIEKDNFEDYNELTRTGEERGTRWRSGGDLNRRADHRLESRMRRPAPAARVAASETGGPRICEECSQEKSEGLKPKAKANKKKAVKTRKAGKKKPAKKKGTGVI